MWPVFNIKRLICELLLLSHEKGEILLLIFFLFNLTTLIEKDVRYVDSQDQINSV